MTDNTTKSPAHTFLGDAGASARMRYDLPTHWIRPLRTMPLVNHDLYVEAAIAECERCDGRRLIEVGCGDGWNCAQLAARGFEVVGTDFNEHAINWARRMAPAIPFYCGDLTDGRFVAEHPKPFDIVLAVEVLEHIAPAECAAAISTMRALVRAGGHLVVTVPSVNLPMNNPEHHRHFTWDLLAAVIEQDAHWRIERIGGCGDIAFYEQFARMRRWFDNRVVHIRAVETLLFRRYLRSRLSTSESKCMNVVARAVAV